MTENVTALTFETAQLRAEMEGLNRLADSFGSKIVTAFSSAVIHGKKLSDVLRDLALSLAQTALSAALRPLGSLLGSLFGGTLANAKGNVFADGRVMPFAAGGIVNSPTLFPMRGATGLMGEAGPEAIMPLARGPDGKLGIRGGGSAVHVTVNISTPDARSFERSQSQITAMMARAVARGQRNL
jgi:phage-related minor tail protein